MTRRIDRMTMRVRDKYHVWHLEQIWEATKDLPAFDVEIESLKHLDAVCWFDDDFKATVRNIVEHFVRMERVNTDYPIILDPEGQLFDGAHRVAKALVNGQRTIKAVRMLEVPPPDEIVDSIHFINEADNRVRPRNNNHLNATIRKANAEDAVAAWEIRNAAILSGCKGYYSPHLLEIWTSGEVSERFIRFVAGQFYVATINDVVVGTGLIDINNGQLDAIFVRPDKMRRGVGRRIVSFLEGVGLASGLTNLKLDSTLNAAEFYRRCGFEGEELGAYKSPRGIVLECIPMTKSLSQPPASG